MNPVAVVTGAASGIGAQCCLDLLERGWIVYGVDRSRESLEGLRASASWPEARFIPLVCDVSVSSEIQTVFQQIKASTNAIDALICSAGVFRTGPVMETSEEDYDALFDINTKGAWLTAKAALPLLRQCALNKQSSRIVLVASIAALRPKVGGGAYAASKAALTQLARVMAVELAPDGILVNAVAPSTVDTPMAQMLSTNASSNGYTVSGVSPIGRIATSSDVTAVIRFLLSDDARYITGAVVPVDGGTSAAYRPG